MKTSPSPTSLESGSFSRTLWEDLVQSRGSSTRTSSVLGMLVSCWISYADEDKNVTSDSRRQPPWSWVRLLPTFKVSLSL